MKKYVTGLFLFILIMPVWAIDCSNMWSWLTKACEVGNQINKEGKQDIYLSGWAWHNRHRYSSEQAKEYQEFAYGGGIGKSWMNSYDNEHSLYGLAFADSHNDPQLMAGYAFQAYWKVIGEMKAGLGYTFGLTSRRKMVEGIPFPYILPVISLRYRAVSIMASYIPHLGKREKGDVVFILGKYTF